MARLPAKLECPEPTVDPGGRLRCRLMVYNAAEEVDEATASAQGPFASFIDISPTALALLPRTEGAFDLTVELPVHARLEAGPHPLLVEARSGLAGTEPSLEELEVTVARRTEAELWLHEGSTGEAGERTYEARVDNHSNHPLSVDVDAETRLRCTTSTKTIEVAAFAAESMTITLERESGDEEPADLTVRARSDGIDLAARAVWTVPPTWLTEEIFPKPPPVPEPEPTPAPVPTPPPTPPPGPTPAPAPKKRRLWAGIAAAIVLLAAVLLLAIPPDVSGYEVLEQRSPRVTADPWEKGWQKALHDLGYLQEKEVDGLFGPRTKGATEAFQSQEDLVPDGVVDADDWRTMWSSSDFVTRIRWRLVGPPRR
jgi:hypothetical protein